MAGSAGAGMGKVGEVNTVPTFSVDPRRGQIRRLPNATIYS
jgi:hypothetical protein